MRVVTGNIITMKNKFKWIAFAGLLLAMLACNFALPQTTPTQPVVISTLELPHGQNNNIPQTEADVPRVAVEAAKAAFDNGQAIILDVRPADAFANGHIAGAISIPLGLIESNPSGLGLDKNKWIITYCT